MLSKHLIFQIVVSFWKENLEMLQTWIYWCSKEILDKLNSLLRLMTERSRMLFISLFVTV